ncbi:unnamed protein product, partial [Darwinula stevensoni]
MRVMGMGVSMVTGLSRKTGRTQITVSSVDMERLELIHFIRTTFKKKECIFYKREFGKRYPHNSEPCFCGSAAEEHFTKHIEAPVVEISKDEEWREKIAIQEFDTDAYGDIEFLDAGTSKPAKYVRLADTADMEDVKKLLIDHWKLFDPAMPNLVISIMGGAKNFKLDGKKKDTFNDGLIKAAKSTHAWLLAGGQNLGCSRSVGEAIRENQFIVTKRDRMVRAIHAIGICSWGYVEGNTFLMNENNINDPGTAFNHVKYKASNSVKTGFPVSLHPDYTHFLLVDDGFRNFNSKGASELRTRLEGYIQDPKFMGIPLVGLLLEGGIESIEDISRRIKKKIPIVLLEGTGRAADILAYAYNHYTTTHNEERVFKKNHMKILEEKLLQAYGKYFRRRPDTLEKYRDMVLQCCKQESLISVFNINTDDDLDLVILSALLKGEQSGTKLEKLKLALMWNRPDIAEERIFSEDFQRPDGALDDMFTDALLQSRVEFLHLLLHNGVSLYDYLTVKKLRDLYTKIAPESSYLRDLLSLHQSSRGSVYLHSVEQLLQRLLRQFVNPKYAQDTYERHKADPSDNYGNRTKFDDPTMELFIWAVLGNYVDVAEFVWDRCASPITCGIVAATIYHGLYSSVKADSTHLKEFYEACKKRFEGLAVSVTDICYEMDRDKAMGVIERRNEQWGGMSTLEVALIGNGRTFIATQCAQESIDQSWRRGMKSASTASVLFAILFPFVVWTRLFEFLPLGDTGGELTPFQKILTFYKAPITKFAGNTLSYVFFLLLYSYMILFDFGWEIRYTEKVVLAWIGIFIIEEFREVATMPSGTISGKLRDWYDSAWNRFDFLAYLLAGTAFGLRKFRVTFEYGRICYALNTAVFYLRLLRVYHAHYHLGPKLVTVYRMIIDVVMFLFLLLVFILGYGIASQSLIRPYRQLSWGVVSDVISTPYWQMYGELLLEELKVDKDSTCPLGNSDKENCENYQKYEWVVPIMLGIYLIISNVLLLNLLIAIFAYVFDEVHEHSMEIWKYEMYRLVRDYDDKPGLIPPFIIFEHVYLFLKFIWKRCCRKEREDLTKFMQRTLEMLKIFEAESLHRYRSQKKAQEANKADKRINKVLEKAEEIANKIEGLGRGISQTDEESEEKRRAPPRSALLKQQALRDLMRQVGL